METKIPPPIVTLVFGLSIYFSRGIFQVVEIKYSFYFGILLLVLGFVILISAVRLFKKDKTTVNPLSPEQATKLVTDGIFKYSRNPMYLGMALVLGSIAVFFNLIGGIILVALFCAYITKFQILPEERAMRDLFSDDFDKYTKVTRRWI
ncbi:isoprenylcysteine carboxylmethyltransferase family protein [Pseudomonadota bacterium]|jgi:protein-S-isoprenylcysteine O-methyltransferase Ste14|nr:isoprenylcysteine carboxylmethyltransferase family protein [Pseudomonadota bacterium]